MKCMKVHGAKDRNTVTFLEGKHVENTGGSMKYGMTESFTPIFMLIFGVVTKSFTTRMFKVTVGSRMRENCTYGS